MMEEVFILDGIRSPIGAINSLLGSRRGESVLGNLYSALKENHSFDEMQIRSLIVGCAMQEGPQALNIARSTLLKSNGNTVGMTVNSMDLSGLDALILSMGKATQDSAGLFLAGAYENMTMIPPGGRNRTPDYQVLLNTPEVYKSRGLIGEEIANSKISKEEQDQYACLMHERANSYLNQSLDEIISLQWSENTLKGDKVHSQEMGISADECPRDDMKLEDLKKYSPVFNPQGTISLANMAPFADGGALFLIGHKSLVKSLNKKPLAQVLAYHSVGGKADDFKGPLLLAANECLKKSSLKIKDLDIIQTVEPYGSLALGISEELKVGKDQLNPFGSPLAFGYPLGSIGLCMLSSMLHEMKRKNLNKGMILQSSSGGMGMAVIVQL